MDFGDTIVVEEEGKKLSDMDLRHVEDVDVFLKEFSHLPIVIISNTIHSNHKDIELLLEELGFLKYIRKVITSVDMNVAKPAPEIFEHALDFLKISPKEALMIGDRLDVDIEGAFRSGIPSMHLHWRDRHDARRPSKGVKPDFHVKNYQEASEILRKSINKQNVTQSSNR